MPWPRSIRNPLTMSESERAKWERTRAKGKRRFIVVRGVLGWGMTTALLVSAWSWIEGEPTSHLWPHLVTSMISFCLVGIVFGSLLWSYMEGRYAASSNQ